MPVLAPADTVVAAADLVKVYGSGPTAVRALSGVTVAFLAMVSAFIKSAGGGVVSIPYSRIALYLVLGACAGLLAAVLPARQAARASVVAAMADA